MSKIPIGCSTFFVRTQHKEKSSCPRTRLDVDIKGFAPTELYLVRYPQKVNCSTRLLRPKEYLNTAQSGLSDQWKRLGPEEKCLRRRLRRSRATQNFRNELRNIFVWYTSKMINSLCSKSKTKQRAPEGGQIRAVVLCDTGIPIQIMK